MNSLKNAKNSLLEQYGPWAVVTGASEGIGKAYARELAAKGFNLVVVARRAALLAQLAADLNQTHGIACKIIAADLGLAAGVGQVVQQTDDLEVGLFIAAAGFGTSGDFCDASMPNEINMLNVNCVALMNLAWHFSRRMQLRGNGGLVMLSSIVAFQGVARSAHYAATKAYVQVLAEGMGEELKHRGVDVLAVAPGPVASGFASRANLTMSQAMAPSTIARESLNELGRKRTSRPGWLSKVLGYALAMTPRWGRIKIMAKVMGGMTAVKQ